MFYIAFKRKKLDFLIYSALFAAFFENLHVFLSTDQPGSYFYNPDFILNILHTPLFVILSWGIILYTSREIIESFTKKRVAQIFLIPLITVLIDFLIEPVAVKLNLWTWVGFENISLYGSIAPANFIGWLGVSFGFVYTYTHLPKGAKWLSSIISYLGFIPIGLSGYLLNQFFKLEGSQTYILVIIYIVLFLLAGMYNARNDFSRLIKKRKLKLRPIKYKSDIIIILVRESFILFAFLMFSKYNLFSQVTITIWIIALSTEFAFINLSLLKN